MGAITLTDKTEFLPDENGALTIPLVLRVSPRARRLSLRVSRLDGRVTLTMPGRVSRRAALGFAHERAGWVHRQLSTIPEPETLGWGSLVPVEGVPLRLEKGGGSAPGIRGGVLFLPARSRVPGVAAEAFFKDLARSRLAVQTDQFATQLGKRVTKLTLRDTRSRWGSCSAHGSLMFSWRLALAPPEILSYVAAHECAHLVEMNHSAAFWKLNADLWPEYRRDRDWLRNHGPALHRWRFRD